MPWSARTWPAACSASYRESPTSPQRRLQASRSSADPWTNVAKVHQHPAWFASTATGSINLQQTRGDLIGLDGEATAGTTPQAAVPANALGDAIVLLPGNPLDRLDGGSLGNVSPCGYCSDRGRDAARLAWIFPAHRPAWAGGRRSCCPRWSPGPGGGRRSIRDISGARFSHRRAGPFRSIGRIPQGEGVTASGRKERRAAAA